MTVTYVTYVYRKSLGCVYDNWEYKGSWQKWNTISDVRIRQIEIRYQYIAGYYVIRIYVGMHVQTGTKTKEKRVPRQTNFCLILNLSKMVNTRHQTPQGQSALKLLNILIENTNLT